jgi:hypothetical protein
MPTSRIWKSVALVCAGLAIAVCGIVLKKGHSLVAFLQNPAKAKGHEALACTPKEEQDDVFFISCGGIY